MAAVQVDLESKIKDFDKFLSTFAKPSGVDGIELFLHRTMSDDAAYGWRRLSITGPFKTAFKADLIPKVQVQYNKTDFVSYEYDAIVDEVIGVAPTDVFPGLSDFLKTLPPRALEEVFSAKPDEFDKYNTRAIALYNAKLNETAYLVSRRNSFETLKRRFLAKYNLASHQFDKAGENLISFGFSVDFIVWRDCFFVDKDFPFQSITGFDELMKKKSEAALDEIEAIKGVSIENMVELKECVQQYAGFRRKLAAASHSGAFKKFDKSKAVAVIDQYNLPVDYDEDGEGTIFSFDLSSQSSRSKVIDLLSDNYVRGEATGLPYIASRKRPTK
tara:strand:+ start:850 stop:1839 length:990 start_codon:yes stop_codon:yes gene_type:complete